MEDQQLPINRVLEATEGGRLNMKEALERIDIGLGNLLEGPQHRNGFGHNL